MVLRPDTISSTKPFSSPSARERLRNSGRVRVVMYFVRKIDRGTVNTNTRSKSGESLSIIKSEPTTVTTEERICTTSCESDVFTVSMS